MEKMWISIGGTTDSIIPTTTTQDFVQGIISSSSQQKSSEEDEIENLKFEKLIRKLQAREKIERDIANRARENAITGTFVVPTKKALLPIYSYYQISQVYLFFFRKLSVSSF